MTTGFATITDDLKRRFGIAFQLVDTGGGCTVLEGRLESGDWLWISDLDAGLIAPDRRAALEARGTHIGWRLQVYPHSSADGGPDINTVLASVAHATGTAADLPGLVDELLGGLPYNAQVTYAVDGASRTSHGIRTT